MSSNFTTAFKSNYSETSENGKIECVPSTDSHLIADMALSVIAFTIQLFLFIALMVYRKKLLQNLIYVYATNVVFANFAFSAVALLISFINYFGYNREVNGYSSTPIPFQTFWFFLQVLVLILFLEICLAIGLLILSVKNKVFRLHRTIAGVDQTTGFNTNELIKNGQNKKTIILWIKKNPKSWAAILIPTLWIIPTLLSFLSFWDLQCLNGCYCLINFSQKSKFLKRCPSDIGCHLIWVGFSNLTIQIHCIAWMICALIVIALFARSYYNFRVILAERRRARQSKMVSSNENTIEDVNFSSEKNLKSVKDHSTSFQKSDNKKRQPDSSDSLLFKSLKKSLFHDFGVAVIFLCGSAPTVFLAFATSFPTFVEKKLSNWNSDTLILFVLLPPIANLVNSIVLCSTHQGLSLAVMRFIRVILTCSCLRKKR